MSNKLKVIALVLSVSLFGASCSKIATQESLQNRQPPQPDYFQKKIDCNNLRIKAEQKIVEDFGSSRDISFDKVCFSKKYNSCVIKYEMWPKDKSISLKEITSFRDILTGELLKTTNSFKEDVDYEYEDRIVEAEREIDCVD
jgi:hypothetical protein